MARTSLGRIQSGGRIALNLEGDFMNQLPLRGAVAPAFFALALASGFLNLQLDRPLFLWLTLLSTILGLAFDRDTRRLLANTFRDGDA
jgi:hypothetical protein